MRLEVSSLCAQSCLLVCSFDGSVAFDKDALNDQTVLCTKNSDEECQAAMEARDEALVRAVADSSSSLGSPFRGLKRKQELGDSSPGDAALAFAKSVPASPPSTISSTLVLQGVASGVADVPAIEVLAKSAAQKKKP